MSDRPWGEVGRDIGPRCVNCGQSIQWSPGAGEPYWYHPATSTIWCDGWGDPDETSRQAEPIPQGGVIRGLGARDDDTIPFIPRSHEARAMTDPGVRDLRSREFPYGPAAIAWEEVSRLHRLVTAIRDALDADVSCSLVLGALDGLISGEGRFKGTIDFLQTQTAAKRAPRQS